MWVCSPGINWRGLTNKTKKRKKCISGYNGQQHRRDEMSTTDSTDTASNSYWQIWPHLDIQYPRPGSRAQWGTGCCWQPPHHTELACWRRREGKQRKVIRKKKKVWFVKTYSSWFKSAKTYKIYVLQISHYWFIGRHIMDFLCRAAHFLPDLPQVSGVHPFGTTWSTSFTYLSKSTWQWTYLQWRTVCCIIW